MIVKPKVGLDEIVFGISKIKIMELLGKPDEIEYWKICDDLMTLYIYNEQMSTFWFNPKDKLEMINTSYHKVYLGDKKIIGASKKKVKKMLVKHKYKIKKYKEDKYFEHIFCQDLNMAMEVEFGRVTWLCIYA